MHSAVGRKSSSRAETGVFRPIHITCLCCYLGGLTKILVLAINKLHNGHDLRKKIFLNFGHFHGRQPFRPNLQPSQKVHRPPTFFQFFLPKSLVPYIRSNICEIQDSNFPYFGKMQFSSFLPFWLFRGNNSLTGQVRSVPYPKIALKWFN